MGDAATELSAFGVRAPGSPDELPNNLPIQLTSFVGRGRELEELEELLASTRLLNESHRLLPRPPGGQPHADRLNAQ